MRRLLLAHLLQLPAVALLLATQRPAAWWCAALWASAVCCLATESHWRWRNRLLLAEAVAWLVAAGVLGS